MKKIRIGISKEIDFKVKPYTKKKFIFNQIDKNNFFYDVILITSNSDIDYKIINKCKSIRVIFIMSLHLLSKIKYDSILSKQCFCKVIIESKVLPAICGVNIRLPFFLE